MKNIDPKAFSELLPLNHSLVNVKNSIDKAANATLGLAMLGTFSAVGGVVLGVVQTGTVIALVSNPVGATVATMAGLAATWKILSNPSARKRALTQSKRQVLEKNLRKLLETETFKHDELAQDIMHKYINAACHQYTPLIIEARMINLRSKLESKVISRVLSDTRKILNLNPTNTE